MQRIAALCIGIISIFSTGCNKKINKNEGVQEMKIGKSFNIKIADNEIVDAEHLKKILDNTNVTDTPNFNLWDNKELKKMIDYMNLNNFIITPGMYTINQTWGFEDGLFKLANGEKREVFKFQTK